MAPSTKLNLKDRLEDGKLDLSMSELQDVPVKEIALLKKATCLDLSNNRLTSLGKNFTSLTHIIKLDLSSNLLTELPASFGEMKQLKHLDLYNNQLKHLPLSLGELKSLKWLDLKNNPLIPALAQVAGQCLDAQQCQQCAKKVVAFMFDMQAKVDEERNRRANQRQKDIDARDAAAAANTKSQQKKNKKVPKAENQNQKVEKQETVTKQNKQTNVQTKPKTTKKQTKNTEQIKQKQKKSSFISTFFKFLFFSFLLAALAMSIFYFKFPSEYDSFKKQSLQVWNQTLNKLPPSVVTTINDALIYVEPAVDFVHSKTNLAVAKLIEVQHSICESEQFKIVQEKVISLWKEFIVKIQDLFRTLYPEK